jgi:hypothetical protein
VHWLIRCAGALCLVAVCAAAAAMSPAAGTDEVLATHDKPQGELQLQYARDSAGGASQSVAIGLGPDYHYLRDENGLRLHDYRERRIYGVSRDQRFTNDSLYAEVWFRVAEMDMRVRMRKAFAAGGVKSDKVPTSQDPFWIESDLGVVSPELPTPEVQRSEVSGRVRWLVGGTEIVAVRYDSEPVPDSIKGGLRRFWGTFGQLHPTIADDLTASGKVPQELWILTQHLGKEPVVMHWKLTARHWRAQASYPLPPHLLAAPTRAAGAFPQIFALLAKNVATHAAPPSQDVYVSRAQNAIDRGADLEAMLFVIEMNLAQGHAAGNCEPGDPRIFCALAAKAGPLVKNDPRYAAAFASQSPSAADRAQYDNLPNAYMLRLLWATKTPGQGVNRDSTEQDLLTALTASPVADFTKDTGDFYAMGFEPFPAWQVWDLGRLMAGHVRDDLLHAIDSLEDQLYIGVPSQF